MIDPAALGLDVFNIQSGEATVICPFHDDTKPSASFNMEKGLFHCFACGASMNAKRLARELGGTIVSLVSLEQFHKTKEELEWRPMLYSPLAIDHPYVEERGLTHDEIKSYDIKLVQLGVRSFGLAFPIKNAFGMVVGLNVRTIPSETSFQARYTIYGEKTALWPLEHLGDEKRPVIVEGIVSAIKLRRAGIPAFATLGAGSINKAIRILNGRKPVVMFDDDYAGYVGAAKFMSSILAIAAVPGYDYDELNDVREIANVVNSRQKTLDLHFLATLSGHQDRFWQAIHRWQTTRKPRRAPA